MTRGMAGKSNKPRKWIITQEIHAAIEKVYRGDTGNGEIAALAKQVGFPRWKITRYAISQGWIAKTKKEPDWSDKELEILERSAHLSPERIAMHLRGKGYHRSVTGIVLKRKRMRFLKNLHGQSARQVATCFGIDDHCIARWIRLGYLKARERGTKRTEAQGGDHWFIKDKWIRDFIINNVAEIDFRKVDKFWLVDLLAGGDVGVGAPKQKPEDRIQEPEEEEQEFCDDDDVRKIFKEAAWMQ